MKDKPLGPIILKTLITLDSARINGTPWVKRFNLNGNALKGLIANGAVEAGGGSTFQITEIGTRMLVDNTQPKQKAVKSAPSAAVAEGSALKVEYAPVGPIIDRRPYTPPVAPTNGHIVAVAPHSCDGCRYKAVLDLVAARIPEAAELLNAVEALDRAVCR